MAFTEHLHFKISRLDLTLLSTARFPTTQFSSAAWLRAFVVLVCATIIGLEGWRDWSSHDEAILKVEVNMANLARSLAQEAEDIFDMADTALVGILGQIRMGGLAPEGQKSLNATLADHVAAMPRFRDILVFNAEGRLVASSLVTQPVRGDASERDYFLHHKSSPNRTPYIGPPVRSQFSGQWVITVSRRITNPDGSFGGVVLTGIDSRSFAQTYAGFNIGQGGAIALLSKNGIMMARSRLNEETVGKDLSNDALFKIKLPGSPVGSYRYASPIDGAFRVSAYHAGEGYPIVVLAAADAETTLAGWRRETLMRGGAIAVLVFTIGLLGSLLTRQLKRRQKAEAQLEEMARTDGLTGLANRRAFDDRLSLEWRRAARTQTPLSILMIDVDHFKPYNDTYGHLAGDECLKAIAKAIGSFSRRPGDLAARYGGEEFAFIAADTDQEGISRLAEELRAKIQALAIPHAGNPSAGVVTVSIGSTTTAADHAGRQILPNTLLTMADEALYKAKSHGRNSVISFPAAA